MILTKYPRTPHLPWSETVMDDDIRVVNLDCMRGLAEVVVTEKMDGECTSMYSTAIHARSLDSHNSSHPSRDWVKGFWSGIKAEIPSGWRICGENLFAKHSIYYSALESYFYGFSIWTDRNHCLSWDETMEWFQLLGITPVPVLYRGQWNEQYFLNLIKTMDLKTQEGYVIRSTSLFHYDAFGENVAKFVRANHVTTQDKHWFNQEITKNIVVDRTVEILV